MSDILWLALISPMIGMVGLMVWGALRGRRWPSMPILPEAEETAQSIRRFQEAAERYLMLDLIWERYSQGRGLFTEELARIIRLKKPAAGKAKQGEAARIPKWL